MYLLCCVKSKSISKQGKKSYYLLDLCLHSYLFISSVLVLEYRVTAMSSKASVSSSNDYSKARVCRNTPEQFESHTHPIRGPMDIFLDEDNGLLYIVNRDILCRAVQVWTRSGEYIRQFGVEELFDPHCITACNGSIFVTDCSNSQVYKFTDYQLACTNGNFQQPAGISSEKRELFVVEPDSQLISVLDMDLRKKRDFGRDIIHQCHSIKVLMGVVYALELKYNLISLIDSIKGTLMTIVSTNKFSLSIRSSFCFCIDSKGNFLIADYYLHLIKVLSPDGVLLSLIEAGDLDCLLPRGIAISSDNIIFVACKAGSKRIALL